MGKALEDVRILDFAHVQSGPTCTQLLGWFGTSIGVGSIKDGSTVDVSIEGIGILSNALSTGDLTWR